MKYDKLVGWKLFAAVLAATLTRVETADQFGQTDHCPKTDDEPEKLFDFWDFVWIGLAILVSWIAVGCL